MTEAFSADAVLRGLTPFQRNTVEHIIDRFYRSGDTSRFLVADETGLGKTIVARGVIARAIEELEHDDAVDRIDIVYVCSNSDLAAQNLTKLNVTGEAHHAVASRLTLLAKHSRHLRPSGARRVSKPVNLVSFTPGTSFEKGWRSGKDEERAMLYLLLQGLLGLEDGSPRERAAFESLRATVRSAETFGERVDELRREIQGELDETVSTAFLKAVGSIDESSLAGRLNRLIDRVEERGEVGPDWETSRTLIGDLRATLARESVQLLEPDLVILDEFQRFRHLLDKSSEAGELAHHLFDHGVEADGSTRPIARTLLLSATPYKPFTYAEESEDHHKDFMQVVSWLAEWSNGDPSQEVATGLAQYRQAVLAGRPVGDLVNGLRQGLLRVMTRTERPRQLAETMANEVVNSLDDISPDSLLGYVALKDLGRFVDAPVSVDYWKSSPYFATFMDGYKIGEKARDAAKNPEYVDALRSVLSRTHHLDLTALDALKPLPEDMGNPRLRQLKNETIDAGWWRLLWLPPTLPYLSAGGPYLAEHGQPAMTKRLVFSSWVATPTAIASLLSYEADRLAADHQTEMTAEERETDRGSRRGRLAYRAHRLDPDRPGSMAHLAMFWPMPGLAELADPLRARRAAGGAVDPAELEQDVIASLSRDQLVADDAKEASHWFEAFAREDSHPAGVAPRESVDAKVTALSGRVDQDDDDRPDQRLLTRHVREAGECVGKPQDRRVTPEVLADLARVAAHSPGNIAYRALSRVAARHEAVTPWGLWVAAATLSSSLRTLFSRPETSLLLDQLIPDEFYWRAILRYCAWGNLQAVMDEYLHHLVVAQGNPQLNDIQLMTIARMAGEAIGLRTARYEVFDPNDPLARPKLSAHFALRYGGRKQEVEGGARLPQVRQAFNSPFRPFVLASTSVGQEGIDFHWWCHAILHWNTPASPIDFEQREGRVDRYDGHAVRRNIVQQHGDAILASDDPDPWDAAYRIAAERADTHLGSFAPHWVYSGDAKIQRHIAPYALSRDEAQLARIKKDVALYRLTFGQPRQEDMLELIKHRYTAADQAALESMRLDLSAPTWSDTDGDDIDGLDCAE